MCNVCCFHFNINVFTAMNKMKNILMFKVLNFIVRQLNKNNKKDGVNVFSFESHLIYKLTYITIETEGRNCSIHYLVYLEYCQLIIFNKVES